MTKVVNLSLMLSAAVLLAACGRRAASSADTPVDPRDTVHVPEGVTGEDSIAYIENIILQSPISAEDLLSLAEVHAVEDWLGHYDNPDDAEEDSENSGEYKVTHRDSAALRLANRFMRMANLVNMNGNANDKLQWALAVNAAIDTFRVAMPSAPKDSALNEISRVMNEFTSWTQAEMNFWSYVDATIDYYRAVEAYRQWLLAVPADIKPLALEEYEAWHDLHDARFAFWRDVSYTQGWYSMKPMEIEDYYATMAKNRQAELDVERSIILEGRPYSQQGTTVTTPQWEEWIAENSVPEDADFLREMGKDDLIPSDSLVSDHMNTLKSAFSRWIAARQAMAAALPKEQGDSYDNLTADIHCRMIGRLPYLIPFMMEPE